MKFNNTKFKSALLLTCVMPVVAVADEVPKAFHGRWGGDSSICNSNGPKADAVVIIDRKGYQGYEISCRIQKIKASTTSLLVANGSCSEEGSDSPTTIKLELLNDGKGLKIGDEKYIRCGKK